MARTLGVNIAPSARCLGGIDVPVGVPIVPPHTISERPVHATVAPSRGRSGERGICVQRFVPGSYATPSRAGAVPRAFSPPQTRTWCPVQIADAPRLVLGSEVSRRQRFVSGRQAYAC